MRSRRKGRPSGSIVVASAAMIIAVSGTALADSLGNGDRLIARGTLSGNRLRNHTITGKQVNLNKLGKVPSAAHADSAATATNATNAITATNAINATNATNATNAANATQLGGMPASAFLTTSNEIGTGGIIKESATPTGATVTLFAVGPFTVTMTCTKSGGNVGLVLKATSTEANSVLFGHNVATANTPTDLGVVTDVPATSSFAEANNIGMDLEAPSGAQALVSGADGVNSLGTDCWANWAGVH